MMSTDAHQDFLMDLVDVVSDCFGEYHFVLDCVWNSTFVLLACCHTDDTSGL